MAAAVPTEALLEKRRQDVAFVSPLEKLLKRSDVITTRISPPRRIFSADDPFGLLERQQTAGKDKHSYYDLRNNERYER